MYKFSQFATGYMNPPRSEITLATRDIRIPGVRSTYILENFLGGGSYGDVFRVRILDDPVSASRRFALKIALYAEDTLKEAEAYDRLSGCGANVVCVYDIFEYTESNGRKWIILVQELLDTDLFNYKPKVSEISTIMIDLLLGLSCIHSRNLAHLDIKAENMFLAKRERNVFKIGDPGIICGRTESTGKYATIKTCTITGTFIPPDLANNPRDNIDFPTALAMDTWDLGLYFYYALVELGYLDKNALELLESAIVTNVRNRVYNKQIPVNYKPSVDLPKNVNFGKISPEIISKVLGHMLQYDSAKRPTAYQILKYIVIKMGWAAPGQEDIYLRENMRKATCATELTTDVEMTAAPSFVPQPIIQPIVPIQPIVQTPTAYLPPRRILKPIYRLAPRPIK